MPAYEEDEADKFDFTDPADWKEIIDSAAYPSSVHVSTDAQEAVLVGHVPLNKVRSAMRYFLGFAYADTTSPWRLNRETPMPHPYAPWLFCSDFSFTPFGLPQDLEEGGQPKWESPFYPEVYHASADHVVATARFHSFRMEFHEDEFIETNRDEWKRYVYVDPVSRVEALSSDGLAQLKYIEGPLNGKHFPAPVHTLMSKVGLAVRWLLVPWEYLSSNDDVFWPQKILNCVGKVNSDTFMGQFPAGTLLMQPPEFQFKPFPVASADDHREPLWAVDVTLNLDFFDPEKGGGSADRGHLLMPSRQDLLWYAVRRDDGVSKFLPEAEFSQVWEHVQE